MLTLFALLACAGEHTHPGFEAGDSGDAARVLAKSLGDRPPNILVIVADDMGSETMTCYPDFGVDQAPQPNLAALCRNGVVFERAWANPMSSPTRATMLTGRDAWRHGVGEPRSGEQNGLPSDELGLPEALTELETGHVMGAFGKWHLADDDNGGDSHPNLLGFDHYAGAIDGQVTDYSSWSKVVDGEAEDTDGYATSENVDDALEWVGDQDDPWLMWVAFNAPHWPMHLPPDGLHSYDTLSGDPDDVSSAPVPYFLSMIESMDTEIGRLLAGIPRVELDNTWIIFVGDNGTWSTTNQDLFDHGRSKGSVFTGGIDVPLVITGPGLDEPGRREDAMVSVADIFATVIELAGGNMDDVDDLGVVHDSVSMRPYLEDADADDQRELNYTAVFGPTTPDNLAAQAVSDGRYKLVRFLDGEEELYDLEEDRMESRSLLDYTRSAGVSGAYAKLAEAIDDRPIDTWWED